VDAAYDAAKVAQPGWAQTPLWKRAELLHKAAALMREHAAPMAAALVAEVAKPAKDAATEVLRSADLISFTAEEGVRRLGEGRALLADSFPGAARSKVSIETRVPLGVVLCVPPFNYPVNLAVSKLGPALIAGNAVVLKPPTQGAGACLHMVACFAAAGFPAGLINAVTGRGAEIGDFMTLHPKVNGISFTGGDTGLEIAKKAAMIPLQMELGGKDCAIVCEDADLDLAAAAIVKGAFSYSGQRCTAVKLVLVLDTVADALVAKVGAKVAKLTVGAPEDNADITALVSPASAKFVEGLAADALAKGALPVAGLTLKREGNLIHPLVLDRVTPDMRLAWEEPFGPVLPIVRVPTVDAAVAHVNASRLALQGCVFSSHIDRALMIADAMSTGTVQINGAPARGPDHFLFAGFRDSGLSSQGVGPSIEFMTKQKSVVINLPSASYATG
jgi:glyceraldehyde-3-phosphate dehydrogenase (NADP+)